jgi:hypothetical protein
VTAGTSGGYETVFSFNRLVITFALVPRFIPSGVIGMQNPPALDPINQLQAGNRPALTSLDSLSEFSPEHWLEVTRLVEREKKEDMSGYVFEDFLLLSH